MSVRVSFYGLGNGQTDVPGKGFMVALDGRQDIHEGPRRVGHCVYCNGLCRGDSRDCDGRVHIEALVIMGKIGGGK